ncbi:MAG TPA: hypothetical protein VMB75_04630 [Rhodocyclaceae bacterium]|nr:hypothetical protein [Rhodocyclaceae bacterium]
MTTALLGLAFAWLAFAGLHSLLASLTAKEWLARRWPAAMPRYRLAFNGIALATTLPLVWASYAFDGAPLWQWPPEWRWLSWAMAIAGLAGFLAASRAYDMDAFLGLRQLREHDTGTSEREGFRISAYHRHVRHPWYFCGLLLVWSGDKTAPLLLSALAITLYFVVGSWLEERKLIALYGEAYRQYMAKVPGLLPLPWKRLSAEEAAALMQHARHG